MLPASHGAMPAAWLPMRAGFQGPLQLLFFVLFYDFFCCCFVFFVFVFWLVGSFCWGVFCLFVDCVLLVVVFLFCFSPPRQKSQVLPPCEELCESPSHSAVHMGLFLIFYLFHLCQGAVQASGAEVL